MPGVVCVPIHRYCVTRPRALVLRRQGQAGTGGGGQGCATRGATNKSKKAAVAAAHRSDISGPSLPSAAINATRIRKLTNT
jgi:hypothetical protein